MTFMRKCVFLPRTATNKNRSISPSGSGECVVETWSKNARTEWLLCMFSCARFCLVFCGGGRRGGRNEERSLALLVVVGGGGVGWLLVVLVFVLLWCWSSFFFVLARRTYRYVLLACLVVSISVVFAVVVQRDPDGAPARRHLRHLEKACRCPPPPAPAAAPALSPPQRPSSSSSSSSSLVGGVLQSNPSSGVVAVAVGPSLVGVGELVSWRNRHITPAL